MEAPWIYSTTFLPYTGEPIEFLLEERNQPISGTFADGVFHSRWADYDADRVASWRDCKDDHAGVSMAAPDANKASFMTNFKRLARMFSRRRNIVPSIILRNRSRTPAE